MNMHVPESFSPANAPTDNTTKSTKPHARIVPQKLDLLSTGSSFPWIFITLQPCRAPIVPPEGSPRNLEHAIIPRRLLLPFKIATLELAMKAGSHRLFLRTAACAALLVAVSTALLDSQERQKLRILVPQSTSALPFFIMAKKSPIGGMTVSVELFVNHPQALALLLKGDADLLLTGTSQGWENRLDGSPIVMVDTGVWGISSLVGRDPTIKGFSDLKGKRIALPFPGSPLDFQTRAILVREKIDPDRDLTISYGAFTQSIPMLLAGQLDAIALPEPQATTIVKERGLARIVTYSEAWAKINGGDGSSPQVSLFATEAFARSHASALVKLIDAWREETRSVQESPAESAAAFASALSTSPDILTEAVMNTLFSVPSFPENKTKILAYYQDVEPYFPGPKRPLDEKFFFLP
jgi:ABC-type nitrate/sulfonate/bicarbonate transport system substrate-binding protein